MPHRAEARQDGAAVEVRLRPRKHQEQPAGAGAGRGGGARGRGAGGVELPNLTEASGYKATDWNDIDIVVDANILRSWLNKGNGGGGAADEELGAFGPLACSAEVRLKSVSAMCLIRISV
jgi:hypothetical protein